MIPFHLLWFGVRTIHDECLTTHSSTSRYANVRMHAEQEKDTARERSLCLVRSVCEGEMDEARQPRNAMFWYVCSERFCVEPCTADLKEGDFHVRYVKPSLPFLSPSSRCPARSLLSERYCYHHAGLPHAPSLSPQRRSMSPRSPLRLNTTPEDPAPSLKQQENFPASTSKQQQPLLQQHQRSSSSTAAGAVSSGDGGSSFGGFSTGSTGSPASRDSEDVTTAVAGDGLGSLLPTGGLAPESSGSSTGRRGGRVSGTARGGRGSAARRGGGAGARVTGVRDGSRCEVPGCATQPRYAPNGASLPRFCGLHKRPGHMNVVSRCCKHPSCSKVPHFANDRERPLYCGEHKLQGMVNVANRR